MNSSTIILILVIILAVAGFSMQYLKGIGKSFQSDQNSSLNATSVQQKQKQKSEDIEDQRRAYMESVKQKMRDAQRR
jgi:multidrug efflux pump subunit AcrB